MSAHWRAMFDNKYIGAWDLPAGKDVALTIDKVVAGELTAQGGRVSKKPIVYFVGRPEKGFALNKTNAKAIAAMYGNDTAKWTGKRIAIYATQTQMAGETVDCIRVRPTPPKSGRGSAETSGPPAEALAEPEVANG